MDSGAGWLNLIFPGWPIVIILAVICFIGVIVVVAAVAIGTGQEARNQEKYDKSDNKESEDSMLLADWKDSGEDKEK
ncbi:MAG TPA: hypothetical protein VFG56_01205 [Candidatus Saccharimonadales bacterium]|nr:hypothetical protein [Candidatus Saccharimonadales bacterium]